MFPLRLWLAGLGLLTLALGAPVRGDGFAGPLVRPPGVDEGELLLGELNCVACHTVPSEIARRLTARPAPLLGAAGLRLTPQWLGAWLLNHEATKPGSAMPDLFAGIPAAERPEAADSLVHFLISQQPAGEAEGSSADPARIQQGRELFHSVGCVACHAPEVRPEGMTPAVFDRAVSEAVPLGDLAHKYYVTELARFLQDPVKLHPGGRMPSLNLNAGEAQALATYLLRAQVPELQDSRQATATIAGLKWEYYESSFGGCADFDKLKPKASGDTPELTAKLAQRNESFGLRFTGLIEAPADGEYTFWTESDDGSVLAVDGKRIVDNDGDHAPTEKQGKIRLTKGLHGLEVRFYQNGSGFEFKVGWAGPGFSRQAIPASALKRIGVPMRPLGYAAFAVDGAKAAKGREWFAKLNCAACHPMAGVAARPAKPLLLLAAPNIAGCLADAVPAGAPKYSLSADQRAALRRAVAKAATLATPLGPARQITTTMTRLSCFACHARDGIGGPAATGRDAWFHIVGEADLGEEGRLPPHLNAVGAKLQPTWTARVLGEGAKVRPYMATRMPVFGAANVGELADAFDQADSRTNAVPAPALTERDAKFGHRLVGRDGLSCIACHTFGNFASLGIPALGLDRMHERLKWDWFRRYLPDPAALRPGTRMPSFWPEGKAVNTGILGGDTDAQIRAIWAWLADGAKAEVPMGLVRASKELLVDQETVIYRNFIDGAGSRAIGVGYPEHASLAFDANQLRLAMIWQGAFIDASRHRTDRGQGYEPPLGNHIVRLPEGPGFAVLDRAEAAWPTAVKGRSPGWQFHGYTLDGNRRPAFRYGLGGLLVEDTIVPKVADVDVTLVRTFRLSGTPPPGSLWFRAAAGDIQANPDGTYTVDGKLKLRFQGGGKPVIVEKELRVPVAAGSQFVEEMTW